MYVRIDGGMQTLSPWTMAGAQTHRASEVCPLSADSGHAWLGERELHTESGERMRALRARC